jgi:hypothetical protein
MRAKTHKKCPGVAATTGPGGYGLLPTRLLKTPLRKSTPKSGAIRQPHNWAAGSALGGESPGAAVRGASERGKGG